MLQNLNPPSDNPIDVFKACIQGFQDEDFRKRLGSIMSKIAKAELQYREYAAAGKLHKIKPGLKKTSKVTTDDLKRVYERGMVQSANGRAYYDKLRAAVPNKRCPLCGRRDVSSLDHYLPKSLYPLYAVAPVNLIPCCRECNGKKAALIANAPEKQTLHPYFDHHLGTEQWLKAEVVAKDPPSFVYYVDPPMAWDDITILRVKHHFELFAIGELYSNAASVAFTSAYRYLLFLFRQTKTGLKEHLQEMSNSAASSEPWLSAMYNALAQDDWFCDTFLPNAIEQKIPT